MFIFTSSLVYRSYDIEFHVEVVIDHMGANHYFYQIVTDDTTYTLSEVEGTALERRIRRIYDRNGKRAVDLEMISFSHLCMPGRMH